MRAQYAATIAFSMMRRVLAASRRPSDCAAEEAVVDVSKQNNPPPGRRSRRGDVRAAWSWRPPREGVSTDERWSTPLPLTVAHKPPVPTPTISIEPGS